MERPACAADLPALTDCLLSAFFADPLWGEWAFPDPAQRGERLRRLMRSWAEPAIVHRWAWMTEQAESVAVWFPPGVREMSAQQERAFEVLVHELFGARAGELQELFERFEQHHPEQPHFYLSLWGTHREHAGQGLGRALIERCLARIDGERMPSYLESSNPANVPHYEGLGFFPRAEFSAPGGPAVTTMWRPPAAPE